MKEEFDVGGEVEVVSAILPDTNVLVRKLEEAARQKKADARDLFDAASKLMILQGSWERLRDQLRALQLDEDLGPLPAGDYPVERRLREERAHYRASWLRAKRDAEQAREWGRTASERLMNERNLAAAERDEAYAAATRERNARAALEREVERWRHGVPIESDYICASALALDEEGAKIEALEDENGILKTEEALLRELLQEKEAQLLALGEAVVKEKEEVEAAKKEAEAAKDRFSLLIPEEAKGPMAEAIRAFEGRKR